MNLTALKKYIRRKYIISGVSFAIAILAAIYGIRSCQLAKAAERTYQQMKDEVNKLEETGYGSYEIKKHKYGVYIPGRKETMNKE